MRMLVLAAVVCVAGPAMAQTVIQGEDMVVYKTVTKIDATEAPIEGTPDKPGDLFVTAPHKAKFGSMLRLRAHFQPELAASVSHL